MTVAHAYVVHHPDGVLRFDPGMGGDPEFDAHHRPTRTPLRSAVPDLDDVTMVATCHLHIDRCDGNPQLSGRPGFIQRVELTTARSTADYTLSSLLDGQSHDTASDVAADALGGGHHAYEVPAGVEHVLALDPRRVVFAHDHAVWEP